MSGSRASALAALKAKREGKLKSSSSTSSPSTSTFRPVIASRTSSSSAGVARVKQRESSPSTPGQGGRFLAPESSPAGPSFPALNGGLNDHGARRAGGSKGKKDPDDDEDEDEDMDADIFTSPAEGSAHSIAERDKVNPPKSGMVMMDAMLGDDFEGTLNSPTKGKGKSQSNSQSRSRSPEKKPMMYRNGNGSGNGAGSASASGYSTPGRDEKGQPLRKRQMTEQSREGSIASGSGSGFGPAFKEEDVDVDMGMGSCAEDGEGEFDDEEEDVDMDVGERKPRDEKGQREKMFAGLQKFRMDPGTPKSSSLSLSRGSSFAGGLGDSFPETPIGATALTRLKPRKEISTPTTPTSTNLRPDGTPKTPLSIDRLREMTALSEETIAAIVEDIADMNVGNMEVLKVLKKARMEGFYKGVRIDKVGKVGWERDMKQEEGGVKAVGAVEKQKPVVPKKKDMKATSAIYQGRSVTTTSTSKLRHLNNNDNEDDDDEMESYPSARMQPAQGFAPQQKKRRRRDSSGSEWSGEENGRRGGYKPQEVRDMDDLQALKVFNECDAATLTGTIACSEEQARGVISLRPFASVTELRTKLTKKKGVSFGLFEQYQTVMQGYIEVDRCLNQCDAIGKEVIEVMKIWTRAGDVNRSRNASPDPDSTGGASLATNNRDAGMHIAGIDTTALKQSIEEETDPRRRKIMRMYRTEQPEDLVKPWQLKDYQLLGVNWLNYMFERRYSCIMADEMGLGKTVQVIAFLCLLRQQKVKGPHLIIVPSSTLENWMREFDKFAPSITKQAYYGSQSERSEQRYALRNLIAQGKMVEVLITTYDLAWREEDIKFLKKRIQFQCCIYDEGHTLKNATAKRYQALIDIQPEWRLLLTGTPLQNNLQELVSLLNFMQERIFEDAREHLRTIFKVHQKGTSSLLSASRVSRARTLMTPFVLRRKKAQVLTDLPPKEETKLVCKLPEVQRKLYTDVVESSRKALAARTEAELEELIDSDDEGKVKKTNAKAKANQVVKKASANILMDLRKAAIHPLLFRRHYTDDIIRKMARDCLKAPEFKESGYAYLVEDMEVMTDCEIWALCKKYPFLNKYTKHADDKFLEAGKVTALREKLDECEKNNRRMLLFSQFTQVLTILEEVLNQLEVRFTRLDGSTKVDERLSLVDDFTNNKDVKVFLLSTRAGGMGINLVAASMVVIFDQDFNPHNDKQAMDRCYRIGQERDVVVYKFISDDTIEEDIYALGETKLLLDEAVGGADGDAEVTVDANGELDDRALQNNTKKSLMKKLRQQVVPEANENGSSKFASGVPAFLQKVYGKEQTNKVQVTLTFAQTVNGKIGNPRGQPQLAVSGSESMEMTHWMRSLHDGIMVGIGTILNDDPRLNVRLLPESEHNKSPQPIILDANLNFPLNARLLAEYKHGKSSHAKQPWLFCRKDTDFDRKSKEAASFKRRQAALEKAGAAIFQASMPDGRLAPSALHELVRPLGIKRLMIEGGAKIIESVLATQVADNIIVTTSPNEVRGECLGYGPPLETSMDDSLEMKNLPNGYFAQEVAFFGKDKVMAFSKEIPLPVPDVKV